MNKKKKKILVIADSPLVPSGVGTQTKYMIEGLLEKGGYSFVCLAGAIKHRDYTPQRVEPYPEDWIIHPVDGYGNPEVIRSMIDHYKPDALWFMTDPRFFIWLWVIEDEIRDKIPMIYYHVWDNYPYPFYNKSYYDSNDVVCTISKVTDNIVRNVSPDVQAVRIPHTVDVDIFKKRSPTEYVNFTKKINSENKFVIFWNNRNARRKHSGTLLFWYKEFLEKIGNDKCVLIMHTEPFDPNGPNLKTIIDDLNLNKGQVIISTDKVSPQELSYFYNISDVTINISDAEGFGLSTLESLSCETPILVNMTGGLQEQVTDGKNWFGIGIEPCSKSIVGSQDVPYIYEDRISKESFLQSLEEMYNMPSTKREQIGKMGRQHVINNYGMEQYVNLWNKTFTELFEKFGSWDSRKNYNRWEIFEI